MLTYKNKPSEASRHHDLLLFGARCASKPLNYEDLEHIWKGASQRKRDSQNGFQFYPFWVHFGPCWGHMGGPSLGPLWAQPVLALLGPLWDNFALCWIHIKSFWGPLGSILGPYEPKWASTKPFGTQVYVLNLPLCTCRQKSN